MKRILNCCASDFGQENTSHELKQAIRDSNGRTLLAEIDGSYITPVKGVTKAEIASAFGADLVSLKHFNWRTYEFDGIAYENPVEEFRRLAGIGVGVNLNVSPEMGEQFSISAEAVARVVPLRPDFISLTGYHTPLVTLESTRAAIDLIRESFDGLLVVHFVINEARELDTKRYLALVEAGADAITMPVPGTVPGVTEGRLLETIDAIHEAGALVSLTTFTSQEGADRDTVREFALSARRAGADIMAFGDADTCGMAAPENLMYASLAMRGKRHTYGRMARSALR